MINPAAFLCLNRALRHKVTGHRHRLQAQIARAGWPEYLIKKSLDEVWNSHPLEDELLTLLSGK
jgi:hypothetical protein